MVSTGYTKREMPLPSNVPTSFVPHSATPPRKFRVDLVGAFGFFSYAILAIVFVLSISVFFYGRILAVSQSSKDTALAEAEKTIDPLTAKSFIRLRDRLSSSKTLLSNHVAFSGFFELLETIMPTTVRFTSLQLSIDNTGIVKVSSSGIAKSFNALALTSAAFAEDDRIKDAIFSSITVNPKDSSVSFALSASLDPKLIAFSPIVLAAAPQEVESSETFLTATTSTESGQTTP